MKKKSKEWKGKEFLRKAVSVYKLRVTFAVVHQVCKKDVRVSNFVNHIKNNTRFINRDTYITKLFKCQKQPVLLSIKIISKQCAHV